MSGSMLRLAAGRFGNRLSQQQKCSRSNTRRFLSEIPIRRNVTKEERALLRAERKQKASKQVDGSSGDAATAVTAAGGNSSMLNIPSAYYRYVWYVALGLPTGLLLWGFSDENSAPAKFCNAIGLTSFVAKLTDPYVKPSRTKLLPDWGDHPHTPADIPCPHTLVLDLENTLISSTWDRKLGWRHAKRPGVDKFLAELAQYYEIVLYTPSEETMIAQVVDSLDKSGCIMHRLYRDATHYTGGVHVKDLKALNRPLNRMVVLDDNPLEVQFNPENLIRVKPYTDPSDREDTTLVRLIPLLIEFAREGYNNIPEILSEYQDMDADEIADEYEHRIYQYTAERKNLARKTIIGRYGTAKNNLPEPELPPTEYIADATPSQLTAKDLVGAAPTGSSVPQEGGGITGWFNRRRAEKEEQNMRKMEKWQEVMMKKQREKQEQLEQQQN